MPAARPSTSSETGSTPDPKLLDFVRALARAHARADTAAERDVESVDEEQGSA